MLTIVTRSRDYEIESEMISISFSIDSVSYVTKYVGFCDEWGAKEKVKIHLRCGRIVIADIKYDEMQNILRDHMRGYVRVRSN